MLKILIKEADNNQKLAHCMHAAAEKDYCPNCGKQHPKSNAQAKNARAHLVVLNILRSGTVHACSKECAEATQKQKIRICWGGLV